MIFNLKEQPEYIEDIEVVSKIKYLGIEIDNKKNYFKSQRNNIVEKARKMANMTYSIIENGCNRLLIGKTYWKSIALPSILYGVNVINLSEEDIDDLQKIENSVYRTILNAPQYAPNSTLRSEIGSSLMKKRIMNGRINFMKSILNGRNKLLENILHRLLLDNDKGTPNKKLCESSQIGTLNNGNKKYKAKVHSRYQGRKSMFKHGGG